MNFTWHEIKETLYKFETLFGVMMLVAAYHLLQLMPLAIEPLEDLIPALILTIVGIGCFCFAVWTHHFWNDPDIWR